MEGMYWTANYRETSRTEEDLKKMQSRLNRIIGQVNGIKKMLDENRYCADILVQVAAVINGLRGFGQHVLEEHLSTCVSDKIKAGDEEVIQETMELIRRLS